MRKFKKIKYDELLLGKDVIVVTNSHATQRGFDAGKVYTGILLDNKDWLVGCPVFKCAKGILGLDYECHLVERVELN